MFNNHLTSSQKALLRALAHHLNPVVIIGNRGLTESVISEIDSALEAHQLVKVRIVDEKDQRDKVSNELCERLNAAKVQQIGKLLVIWRLDTRSSEIEKPKKIAGCRPAAKKTLNDKAPSHANSVSSKNASRDKKSTKPDVNAKTFKTFAARQSLVSNDRNKPKANERLTSGGLIKKKPKRQTSQKKLALS